MSARPRRALPPEEDELPSRSRPTRALAASCIVSILCVAIAYLVWGPKPTTTEVTPIPPAATSTPGQPGTTDPTVTSAPTPSPTESASPAPSAGPLPTLEAPSTTSEPSDTALPEVEPEATAPPAGHLELNDTSFTAPDGWVLYGDDLIEGDRRMVRLSQGATDTRLQAVSLLVQDTDLGTACSDLVQTQGAQFTLSSEQLTLPIGIDAALGQGVTCGFSGVRLSDGVANSVTFTLVRRSVDGNVLMLRHTVPTNVASGDPARRQLAVMSCQATDGFGTPLPLC